MAARKTGRDSETKRILKVGSVLLAAWSFLFLSSLATAQTLTHPGNGSLTQQAVLPTQFGSAAIQKAIKNLGDASLQAPRAMLLPDGPAATQPSKQTVLHGVWGKGNSKATPESVKVCAVPLLEHKADKDTDPGIWYSAPNPNPAGSAPRQLTDPMAVPPPIPACTAQR